MGATLGFIMIFDIIPYEDRHNKFVHDFEAFHAYMRKYYPDIIGRKRFCCTQEEATEKLRNDCWGFRFILQPVSTFKETTFSAKEMAALKIVVDHAAKCCGGGEDTMGAILYTGAFHQLDDGEQAVVDLARKIDCYED